MVKEPAWPYEVERSGNVIRHPLHGTNKTTLWISLVFQGLNNPDEVIQYDFIEVGPGLFEVPFGFKLEEGMCLALGGRARFQVELVQTGCLEEDRISLFRETYDTIPLPFHDTQGITTNMVVIRAANLFFEMDDRDKTGFVKLMCKALHQEDDLNYAWSQLCDAYERVAEERRHVRYLEQ